MVISKDSARKRGLKRPVTTCQICEAVIFTVDDYVMWRIGHAHAECASFVVLQERMQHEYGDRDVQKP